MIVAIASGKGGTGKTTVAAALLSVWDTPVTAVDLDVEAPNLHLFLNPTLSASETAFLETPVIDEDICTRCRACSDLCQYKALAVLGQVILTFPEMCHGCGGCQAVCPVGAVSPGKRNLGTIEYGSVATDDGGRADFLMGRLRVGESMSPPLLRQVTSRLAAKLAATPGDALLDCPPGVSCPAVSAVRDADVILLVTEPTPFGFYDFRLAVAAFAPMGKPMAVVINRAGTGDTSVEDFCRQRGLPILTAIPADRAVAEAYSKGRLASSVSPELRQRFVALRQDLRALAREAAHA